MISPGMSSCEYTFNTRRCAGKGQGQGAAPPPWAPCGAVNSNGDTRERSRLSRVPDGRQFSFSFFICFLLLFISLYPTAHISKDCNIFCIFLNLIQLVSTLCISYMVFLILFHHLFLTFILVVLGYSFSGYGFILTTYIYQNLWLLLLMSGLLSLPADCHLDMLW